MDFKIRKPLIIRASSAECFHACKVLSFWVIECSCGTYHACKVLSFWVIECTCGTYHACKVLSFWITECTCGAYNVPTQLLEWPHSSYLFNTSSSLAANFFFVVHVKYGTLLYYILILCEFACKSSLLTN